MVVVFVISFEIINVLINYKLSCILTLRSSIIRLFLFCECYNIVFVYIYINNMA